MDKPTKGGPTYMYIELVQNQLQSGMILEVECVSQSYDMLYGVGLV